MESTERKSEEGLLYVQLPYLEFCPCLWAPTWLSFPWCRVPPVGSHVKRGPHLHPCLCLQCVLLVLFFDLCSLIFPSLSPKITSPDSKCGSFLTEHGDRPVTHQN
jgi:hypothetical protein